MTPSQDQVLGILRIILPMLLAWFAGKGYITNDAVAGITTAIVGLIAVVWSGMAHTQAATVAKVAAMDKTAVSPDGKTITLHDPALANAAAGAATPLNMS
jgi:hypothetical protein